MDEGGQRTNAACLGYLGRKSAVGDEVHGGADDDGVLGGGEPRVELGEGRLSGLLLLLAVAWEVQGHVDWFVCLLILISSVFGVVVMVRLKMNDVEQSFK